MKSFCEHYNFTSAVSSLQVAKNGTVISKTTLKAQLLDGIVSRIPDYAFKVPPYSFCDKKNLVSEQAWNEKFIEHERKSLNKKVAEIQRQLNSKHPKTAAISLRMLIEKIERITYPNYSVNDNYWLSQRDVISEINSLIQGLDNDERECDHRGW